MIVPGRHAMCCARHVPVAVPGRHTNALYQAGTDYCVRQACYMLYYAGTNYCARQACYVLVPIAELGRHAVCCTKEVPNC